MTTSTQFELCFSTEQRYLIDDAAARLRLPVTEFAKRILLHEAERVVAVHAELVGCLREEFLGSDTRANEFFPNEKLARAIKSVRG